MCRVKIKETVFNYGQKMSLFHTFYTVVLGYWSSVLASIDLRIVSFLESSAPAVPPHLGVSLSTVHTLCSIFASVLPSHDISFV